MDESATPVFCISRRITIYRITEEDEDEDEEAEGGRRKQRRQIHMTKINEQTTEAVDRGMKNELTCWERVSET